jgi:hypothetical protein
VSRCPGFERPPSRRDLLARFSSGLGGIALASLLGQERALAAPSEPSTLNTQHPTPHQPPKAKKVIQIFLQGGLSQVDSFDYRPELIKYHGKSMPFAEKPDPLFGQVGLLHRPHFEFRQRGRSGLWMSDLFPEIAGLADELTLLRSMYSGIGNHTPATYEANSGFRTLGFPCAGAWISYGLGSEADNLPAFVVLPDSRSWATGGANNWTSGFLPARHQGVVLNTRGPAIRDLQPASGLDPAVQSARYQALAELNRRHLESHGGEEALASRMRSYELAARMQLAVPGVVDLGQESEGTRALYGIDRPECADFGRSCLLARRLVERGVRFVQLWSGGAFGTDTHWDAHGDVPSNHRREALKIDRPVAGLLRDLRARGMLEETLVVFNTEFGRTPFAQSAGDKAGPGRDHNPEVFTAWLAGAGLKPGTSYGSSDEVGWRAEQEPVSVHDFHATILHLLGIDHKRLTFNHNRVRRRLTDVHGRVLGPILA